MHKKWFRWWASSWEKNNQDCVYAFIRLIKDDKKKEKRIAISIKINKVELYVTKFNEKVNRTDFLSLLLQNYAATLTQFQLFFVHHKAKILFSTLSLFKHTKKTLKSCKETFLVSFSSISRKIMIIILNFMKRKILAKFHFFNTLPPHPHPYTKT